jgi:hypothetical protein
MERIPVLSSVIRSVGYDNLTSTLEIEFVNGGIYQYSGLPAEIHAALMSSGSKGSYFDQYIRSGPYNYRRMSGSL